MTTPPTSPGTTAPPQEIFTHGVVESIEKFDGSGKITEFLEIIDMTGDLYNWTDEIRMKVCKIKLRGLALAAINRNSHINTWKGIKDLLIDHFAVKITPFQAMQAFQNTHQRQGQPILDFSQELEKNGRKTLQLTGDRTEDGIILKTFNSHLHIQFLAGMLPYLREKVVLRGTTDYKNAVEVAMEMEASLRTWRRPERTQAVQQRPPLTCYNCKQVGHVSRDCKNTPISRNPMKCFKCNEPGHFKRNCPKNWQPGNSREPPNQRKRF